MKSENILKDKQKASFGRKIASIFILSEVTLSLFITFWPELVSDKMLEYYLIYPTIVSLYVWFVINNHKIFHRFWDKTTLILLDAILLLALLMALVFKLSNS